MFGDGLFIMIGVDKMFKALLRDLKDMKVLLDLGRLCLSYIISSIIGLLLGLPIFYGISTGFENQSDLFSVVCSLLVCFFIGYFTLSLSGKLYDVFEKRNTIIFPINQADTKTDNK